MGKTNLVHLFVETNYSYELYEAVSVIVGERIYVNTISRFIEVFKESNIAQMDEDIIDAHLVKTDKKWKFIDKKQFNALFSKALLVSELRKEFNQLVNEI